MPKAVDDMSMEEIREERARLAQIRAALNGNDNSSGTLFIPETISPAKLSVHEIVPEVHEIVPEDPGSPAEAVGTEPAPWMHSTITMDDGHVLEYRHAGESALIAISMANMMAPQMQLQVLGAFMGKHLSADSFTHVVMRLADPDDTFTMSDLIKILAEDSSE